MNPESKLIPKIEQKTLPAVEVKNEVVWVNDKVAMPFVFEEGKPSKLGIFFTPKPKEGEPIFSLGVTDEHFRSGNLGKVIFQDKENPKRVYRDVDLKGVGGFIKENKELVVDPLYEDTRKRTPYGKGIWGIMNAFPAEYDRDMSEKLIALGLRTHRVLAIIRLKELVGPDGNKISLKKAAEKGYIKTTTKPVVEVRAFGTKNRINDLFLVNGDGRKVEALLKDSKQIVAKERNLNPESFSTEDYLRWFAETLGQQVATLHKNSYSHGFLTAHNLTLDCSLVDLDSVEPLEGMGDEQRKKEIKRDLEYAKMALGDLVKMLGFTKEVFQGIFSKSYTNNL